MRVLPSWIKASLTPAAAPPAERSLPPTRERQEEPPQPQPPQPQLLRRLQSHPTLEIRVPTVTEARARLAAAGDAAGGAPSPSAATYRRPPRPPAFINTFRIEEMLRAAMQAAEHDVSRAATFERVLGRHRQHPGVLRRRREREAARRAEHERTSRAFYWAKRRRVPEGVHHRLSSLDELVDAGCSWEVATELMRFPMLKLLRYDAKRLMALPAHELVMFNLDRRMGESHARAAIYLASDAFGGLRIASSASRLAAGATQQRAAARSSPTGSRRSTASLRR